MQAWFENLKAEFDLNFIQGSRWKFLLTGLGNTLQITGMALAIGLIIGMIIAAVRSTYDKTEANARPSFSRRIFGFFFRIEVSEGKSDCPVRKSPKGLMRQRCAV